MNTKFMMEFTHSRNAFCEFLRHLIQTRMLSDADLRSDFDACVNLYQDFIKQSSKTETRESNISEIGRDSGGGRDQWDQ